MFNINNIFKVGIFLLFSSSTYAGVIDSAERYWTFDNTFNESISGILGHAEGGVGFGTDRFGNENSAISFDGFDDRLLIDNTTDLPDFGDFSVSLWFLMNEHTGRAYLFDSRAPGSTSYSFIFIDRIGAGPDSHGEIRTFNSPRVLQPNLNDHQWHNLIYTNNFTDGYSKVYLDAVEISSQASTVPTNFNGGLSFGALGAGTTPGGNYWFNGKLDDIAIWGKALTADDVQEVYANNGAAIDVPEPSTIAVLSLGMLVLGLRRFNQK